MKKIIAAALASAMLITGNALAVDFADTKGHWAEANIERLVHKGIVDGMTDTEFMPEAEVTRAQYLKMIMSACGLKTAEYREGGCLEAKSTDWYAPYLQSALDCGLIPENMIAGYKSVVSYELGEDGRVSESGIEYSGAFNGDLPISREEMAVLTQNVYQYTRTVLTNHEVDTKELKDFEDQQDISEWARQSVKMAAANGFIEGTDDGRFDPNGSATRAQAATVIIRVIDKEQKKK